MILVEARFCNKSSDVEASNRKTLKARWRMPRGWDGENSWEDRLDAESMRISLKSVTRTVSRSMNWAWDMELPSQVFVLLSDTMTLEAK